MPVTTNVQPTTVALVPNPRYEDVGDPVVDPHILRGLHRSHFFTAVLASVAGCPASNSGGCDRPGRQSRDTRGGQGHPPLRPPGSASLRKKWRSPCGADACACSQSNEDRRSHSPWAGSSSYSSSCCSSSSRDPLATTTVATGATQRSEAPTAARLAPTAARSALMQCTTPIRPPRQRRRHSPPAFSSRARSGPIPYHKCRRRRRRHCNRWRICIACTSDIAIPRILGHSAGENSDVAGGARKLQHQERGM